LIIGIQDRQQRFCSYHFIGKRGYGNLDILSTVAGFLGQSERVLLHAVGARSLDECGNKRDLKSQPCTQNRIQKMNIPA